MSEGDNTLPGLFSVKEGFEEGQTLWGHAARVRINALSDEPASVSSDEDFVASSSSAGPSWWAPTLGVLQGSAGGAGEMTGIRTERDRTRCVDISLCFLERDVLQSDGMGKGEP